MLGRSDVVAGDRVFRAATEVFRRMVLDDLAGVVRVRFADSVEFALVGTGSARTQEGVDHDGGVVGPG